MSIFRLNMLKVAAYTRFKSVQHWVVPLHHDLGTNPTEPQREALFLHGLHLRER